MARNGIAPLSTTIALAFTRGSSTTSQRPTPRRITTTRTKPLPTMAERMSHLRERGRETTAGLSEFAIWEPAHAIPPRHTGHFGAPHHRLYVVVSPLPFSVPGPQKGGGKNPRHYVTRLHKLTTV